MNERKNNLIKQLKGVVTMANTIINGGASPYPKGASGDIITITDGAENAPLKSAVVNIEPAQDLHGYDYPWPAGSGANKIAWNDGIDFTLKGVRYYVSGGKLYLNGTSSGETSSNDAAFEANFKFKLPAGTYYFTRGNYPNATYLMHKVNGENAGIETNSGAFTLEAEDEVWVGFYVYNKTFSNLHAPIQIVQGSTEPATFSPYSNICPISGWTQVKVWVKPTYDTSLTPTATISLGQTVYGGTVDVVNGVLTVDSAIVDLGNLEWVKSSSGRTFYATLPQYLKDRPNENYICTRYKFDGFASSPPYYGENGTFRLFRSGASPAVYEIYIHDENYNDAVTFKSAMSEVQLLYPVTPIEVDLTPQTIKTLLGTNNIWADAGEMSIEYYPAAASIVAVQNRSTKAYVSIPLGMIRYETYQITPQQTIDLDSYRSENGNLLRNPVATKCKLEFNTPLMTDTQWAEIWNIIKAGFNNNTERKLKLKYYDTLSATYKTGYFYVPDVQTTIRNIEEGPGVINYQEIRLAFIEY